MLIPVVKGWLSGLGPRGRVFCLESKSFKINGIPMAIVVVVTISVCESIAAGFSKSHSVPPKSLYIAGFLRAKSFNEESAT